jgi:MFS family permease
MSWLADRSNRRNILAVSLIIWSGFTALCGLSRNYWEFLGGRIGVGVGEAGGTPPSNSIIADYFTADKRPMALGAFALGAPIGAWLGANMAGAVAHAYGWRAAFLALGIPGVVMAGVGLTTIPSFIAYWTTSLTVTKAMFWIFIPAIYFYIGPCMGLMQNLAPPRMRAMFTAWSLVVGNVFNLIVAPQAVGVMSDWFARGRGADAASLRLALLMLAPTGFWAVYHFWMAGKTIVADQERATGYTTV